MSNILQFTGTPYRELPPPQEFEIMNVNLVNGHIPLIFNKAGRDDESVLRAIANFIWFFKFESTFHRGSDPESEGIYEQIQMAHDLFQLEKELIERRIEREEHQPERQDFTHFRQELTRVQQRKERTND